MNYLAHALLSFDDEAVLAGNMISDFVKGKAKFNYPKSIRDGIVLHRMIDAFTDTHATTAQAKTFFRPYYRLYSGAITDIVYDHFLALDMDRFTKYGGLEKFSLHTYRLLDRQVSFFPPRFGQMYPYMKSQNWLYDYRLKDGIRQAFFGLQHRALYISETGKAFSVFLDNYDQLQKCYDAFFPDLWKYSLESLSNLKAE